VIWKGTLGALMPGDREIPRRPGKEGVGLRRRLSLGVTASLHRIVSRLTGVALAGHPQAGGIPVLRGRGAGPAARARLEAALDLLVHLSPGLRSRLQRHVTGLFLMRRAPVHGYYSRITGTCTLDLDTLDREPPAEVAGAMVRCATEGWLWRSGRGRSRDDEARILAVSELARLHFLRRAVGRPGTSF
jgi:hypothetical protein